MSIGDITMSKKEVRKLEVMSLLAAGEIKQKNAAEQLGLGVRQIRRIYKKYKREGAIGLVSRRRGRPNCNRLSAELKQEILELLRNSYADFGPTLAKEKLLEKHRIKVSKETVRNLMIAGSIWESKRRRKLQTHQLRERRSNFGELVQIDGSPHAWFEERGEKCCLLVFIDDATSKILQLLFVPIETTVGYFKAMREYIERCGVPVSIYSDKHSIFRINMPESKHEGETQFQRAMGELGIKPICANSPQAKGRVERANGILQDRLVKELRLEGINDIETANAYLPEFMKRYNAKFAKEPKSPADMHRKLNKSTAELNLIFSEQNKRKLSKNLELSYKDVMYQLQIAGQGYALRGASVKVCEGVDGTIKLICMGKEREYKCYEKSKRATQIVEAKEVNRLVDNLVSWKPAADHPWRRFRIKQNAAVCR